MRHDASTVAEVFYDATRRDRRMQDFLQAAKEAGVRLIAADETRLWGLAHTERHQGVVARVEDLPLAQNLAELLDGIAGPALLLVLDGVTDPHNLGACLRVADAAGAHAAANASVSATIATRASRTALAARHAWRDDGACMAALPDAGAQCAASASAGALARAFETSSALIRPPGLFQLFST